MTIPTTGSISTGNINSGNRINHMSGMSGISEMVINDSAIEDEQKAQELVTSRDRHDSIKEKEKETKKHQKKEAATRNYGVWTSV